MLSVGADFIKAVFNLMEILKQIIEITFDLFFPVMVMKCLKISTFDYCMTTTHCDNGLNFDSKIRKVTLFVNRSQMQKFRGILCLLVSLFHKERMESHSSLAAYNT